MTLEDISCGTINDSYDTTVDDINSDVFSGIVTDRVFSIFSDTPAEMYCDTSIDSD